MIATAYNNQPNTTDTHGHAQRSMSIRRAVICVEGGCVLEGESTSYGSTAIVIRAACGGCGGRGLWWL